MTCCVMSRIIPSMTRAAGPEITEEKSAIATPEVVPERVVSPELHAVQHHNRELSNGSLAPDREDGVAEHTFFWLAIQVDEFELGVL